METTVERVWDQIKDAPPAVLLLLFGALLVYTTLKIRCGLQLRGVIPGATEEEVRVTQMWTDPISGARWISWQDEVDVKAIGKHRTCVSDAQYERLSIGSPQRLISVPGFREKFVPGSKWEQKGNLIFDALLWSVEFVLCGWMVWRLVTGD